MLEYGFKIKVSDLLLNPGKKDIIKFENKKIISIENLSQNGIKGELIIQSLDKSSILVILKNIELYKELICDKCLSNYLSKIFIKEYSSKFFSGTDDKNDEDFLINIKDESIDIEEMLYQGIIIQDQIVNICEKCSKIVNNEDDEYNQRFETKIQLKIN